MSDFRLLSASPVNSDTNVTAKKIHIIYFNQTRSDALSKHGDNSNQIFPLPKINPQAPFGQRISRRGGLPPVDASPLRQQAPTKEEDDEWNDGDNDKTKAANTKSARNQKHNTLPSPPSATESPINSDHWAAAEKGIFVKSDEQIFYGGDNFYIDPGLLFFYITFN